MSERASAPRRLLLVSRELPPAIGPHPIRVAKLAKYLPEFGWKPTILTVPVDHAWATDDALLVDLDGIEVVRVPRLFSRVVPPTTGHGREATSGRREPTTAGRRVRTNIAELMLLPDRDILWALPAARRGARLASRFDAVLTTAPPFSTHLVGFWLSLRDHLPWVADYRDNWSMNPFYRRGTVPQHLNCATERRLLARADGIITVSEAAAGEIESAFPSTAGKLSVAMNGFDPDDMPSTAARPEFFEIAYMGTLDERRDPRPFVEALRLAAASEPGFSRTLRLSFMGNVAMWAADAATEALGQSRVRVHGLLPHREALTRAAGAAVLLGITTRAEAGGAGLTSKIFEYLGLRRPVLMLAPPGPARSLVTDLDAGETADPEDVEAIRVAVLRLHDNWRSGRERTASEERLESLTRRTTAARVSAALDAVLTHAVVR
jgi:glycosyltransferase involved in cell wall biosynthesis